MWWEKKRTLFGWICCVCLFLKDGRTVYLLSLQECCNTHLKSPTRSNVYNEDEHSAAMSIRDATETADPEEIKRLIHDLVDRLFMDAGVKYERVSKRGERYSIAYEAYNEFARWFDYPWD